MEFDTTKLQHGYFSLSVVVSQLYHMLTFLYIHISQARIWIS